MKRALNPVDAIDVAAQIRNLLHYGLGSGRVIPEIVSARPFLEFGYLTRFGGVVKAAP
jgi:hypothetical protein